MRSRDYAKEMSDLLKRLHVLYDKKTADKPLTGEEILLEAHVKKTIALGKHQEKYLTQIDNLEHKDTSAVARQSMEVTRKEWAEKTGREVALFFLMDVVVES